MRWSGTCPNHQPPAARLLPFPPAARHRPARCRDSNGSSAVAGRAAPPRAAAHRAVARRINKSVSRWALQSEEGGTTQPLHGDLAPPQHCPHRDHDGRPGPGLHPAAAEPRHRPGPGAGPRQPRHTHRQDRGGCLLRTLQQHVSQPAGQWQLFLQLEFAKKNNLP